MKIEFPEKLIRGKPLFKLFFIGYFFGAGALFLIPYIGIVLGTPFREGELGVNLLPVLLGPIILALQAVIFAGFSMMGIWLAKRLFNLKITIV